MQASRPANRTSGKRAEYVEREEPSNDLVVAKGLEKASRADGRAISRVR